MDRVLRLTRARALAASALIAMISVTAAAQTQQQLEVFRSLTPEQQRQILDQARAGQTPETVPAPAAPTSRPKNGEAAADTMVAVEMVAAEPRLRAGDTLLLTIAVPPGESRVNSEYQQRVLDGNPYRLDRIGQLTLHDATSIGLAGLTEAEAIARLNAEPSLRGFRFGVQLLPVDAELRPFGYDLFSNVPTTFAPATDIPVPANYVIGPGDTFEVQLIGERGGRYTLVVGRDGVVDFPELGPIAVAGLRFEAARTLLEQRVSEQMIGMRASVSMGALRSIQVFVLGEAERPGSYTVSGLSTITHALFASGGVKPIGSLRNIELKRNGNLVQRLDLYDLLLKGDTSNDSRLLPGDVIFIPPIGTTVAISGEIQRPAIYEVPEGAAASEVLHLSGGLTPAADPRIARLERIDERRNRTVINLDLTTPAGRGLRLQTGDAIRIESIRDTLEGAVSLEGHVHRQGKQQFYTGMKLTDLVGSLDELQPRADLHYVLIRRESGPERKVSVVSADLAQAFAAPDSAANISLQARDRVHVFDLATSRDRIVSPILRDLERQSGRDETRQVVGIGGRVKVPGQYPLEPAMTVSGLLRAGGSLDEAAYRGMAELTRYEVIGGERRQTELIEIDLAGVMAGDAAADLRLQPFDFLVIREMPDWRDQETIAIAGEVRFPGTYPVMRGETLRSVIARAGGLTDLAFARGSVFTRAELKSREQRQLQVLAERLQRELAALSLQQAQSQEASATGQAMSAGQALLADLRATEAVGRLVIDLEQVMSAGPKSQDDLIVKNGDRLYVPRLTQEVTVIGEVQSATSHLFQAGLTRDDYIQSSGGLTQRADSKRTFIIRANGSVAGAPGNAWFSRGGPRNIEPGDTIVVPLDAQQMKPLTVWTSVTQILYNIAVAVAAVNSF